MIHVIGKKTESYDITSVRILYRLNSKRNSKNVIFEYILSFLRVNRNNDNQGEFPDFNDFTLYMVFEIFHENSHYRNGQFLKNREIHIKDEFVKIQEFTLVIIFVIFCQLQFRLKK